MPRVLGQRVPLSGPPILVQQQLDLHAGYATSQTVVNITFVAGTNTMDVARLASPRPQFGLIVGLKRPRMGPPILTILQQGTLAPATVAYTLSSTVQNITFAAGTNTATKALTTTSATKNITFLAGANTTSVGVHLSSAVKNITFLAGSNSTSVARILAGAAKNIAFAAGSNTHKIDRTASSDVQNITFTAGANDATYASTRKTLDYTAGKGWHHYGIPGRH